MLHLIALVALAQGGGDPPPVGIQVQYDPTKTPGHPTYDETLANLIWPVGKGPVSQGYPVQPLPVMVFLRGGNTNNLAPGLVGHTAAPVAAKDAGIIGVDCNFAVMDPGEDMTTPVADIALLIQYLRHEASELNIDPDRVFLQGRSAGTLLGHSVALQEDHLDLASPVVQHHQSSRPTYWIPRFGPSTNMCYSDEIGSWASVLSTFLFPGKLYEESTPQERLEWSPVYWLQNPHLYGRTYTPPMCVAHHAGTTDVCGTITDVHSGLMGIALLRSIEDFTEATGDTAFLERSSLVDMTVWPDPTLPIVLWMIVRLAEDFGGLHLGPPLGAVGPSGGNVTLDVYGGTPGSTITFYTGTPGSAQPLAGCADKTLVAGASSLGTAVVNPNGRATLTFDQSASVVGTTVVFQAVDHATCEVSGAEVHLYY